MPVPAYDQLNGACPSPPKLTVALCACSSKVKEKGVSSGGSGTAMIVSTGESNPRSFLVPTVSPPNPYWSTAICSQRR